MELLYVNFLNRDIHYYNEFYYFVLNYIIGEKVHIYSNVGFSINGIKNIDKFTNDELVDYLENFFIQTALPEKTDVSKVFESFDYAKKQFKMLISLKSIKKIPNQYLKVVQAHHKMAKGFKDQFIDSCKGDLDFLNLSELINLYDENIFELGFSTYTREYEIIDDVIADKLYKNFISRERLIVLEDIFHVDNNLERYNEVFELQINEMGNVNIIRLPILTIPCSQKTTSKDLIILRTQFQYKFNKLLSKIQAFRMEIIKYKINHIVSEKFKTFVESVQDEIYLLQDVIDENIYFQKIKNSDSDFISVKIEIVILPIEFLLTFYAYDYALSIKKTIELRDKVYEEIGENMSEVFIYYNTIPKNNEQQSSNEIN